MHVSELDIANSLNGIYDKAKSDDYVTLAIIEYCYSNRKKIMTCINQGKTLLTKTR